MSESFIQLYRSFYVSQNDVIPMKIKAKSSWFRFHVSKNICTHRHISNLSWRRTTIKNFPDMMCLHESLDLCLCVQINFNFCFWKIQGRTFILTCITSMYLLWKSFCGQIKSCQIQVSKNLMDLNISKDSLSTRGGPKTKKFHRCAAHLLFNKNKKGNFGRFAVQ